MLSILKTKKMRISQQIIEDRHKVGPKGRYKQPPSPSIYELNDWFNRIQDT